MAGGHGVRRLDAALWQARLDECGAEPSGWRGMRCVGLGRGFGWGMVGDVIEHQS